MRERDRQMERRRLDEELRPFRRAGNDENPTNGLLKAIRKALGVPVAEISARMGVVSSLVYDFEARELSNTINLGSMGRMAEAMGCKVVYGIVPLHGQTLEGLAEERLWKKVLKGRERGNEGTRESFQLSAFSDQL